ncbi:hypothetical protein N0V95_010100, partial [Ascochyta clinopodiicola]
MCTIIRTLFTLSSLLTITLSRPTNTSSWTALAPISIPRQEHSTVFLPPSTIAILGGIVPTYDNSTMDTVTTPLVEIYSIQNNTWAASAPLPRAMNHLNAAVVNGKIYVLGGLADMGETKPAWRAVPDSYVYTPSTNTWSDIPGLHVGELRGSAAMGVYKHLIILAGGLSDLERYPEGRHNTVTVVSVFDTVRRKWLHVPDEAKYLPQGRDHAGAAVVEGR